MESVFQYAVEQYSAIQESRRALFEYCKTIHQHDFLKENSSFGRGSIRNLLVHIANVYQFWVAKNALEKDVSFTPFQSKQGIDEVIELFHEVDLFMKEFMQQFRLPKPKEVQYSLNGITGNASWIKIFTHVITHEAHHKGQILSLSRHLGYIPVDTDVIR